MSVKRKIAVIGAGWSGLSAAVNLAGKADVTVFEAGKTAGGRAAIALEQGAQLRARQRPPLLGAP